MLDDRDASRTPSMLCVARLFGFAAALLLFVGCSAKPIPDAGIIEEAISVDFPDDAKVIGGQSEARCTSLLIVSKEILPLPLSDEPKSRRKKKRRGDVLFPVSALSNLMAAYGVDPNDVPTLTGDQGRSIEGETNGYQYNYREAATDSGWLTAVEIFSLDKANQTVQQD